MKINLLYIDDDILFIRTVQRIIKYGNWNKKIDFLTAFDPYDAYEKICKSAPFDIILVDYRLEPDRSASDECNGEELIKILKEKFCESKCKESQFFILTATEPREQCEISNIIFNKGSDNLEEELERIFKEIQDKIIYPESKLHKDDIANNIIPNFKGNSKPICRLRYDINTWYTEQNKEPLLIIGEKGTGKTILVNDIVKKEPVQCRICSNHFEEILYNLNQHQENTIVGFDNINYLKPYNQYKLSEWVKNKKNNKAIVCTCTDRNKIEDDLLRHFQQISIPSLNERDGEVEQDIIDIAKSIYDDKNKNSLYQWDDNYIVEYHKIQKELTNWKDNCHHIYDFIRDFRGDIHQWRRNVLEKTDK